MWNNSTSGLVSMIDILLILSCVFLPGNLWVLEIVNFILLGVEFFYSYKFSWSFSGMQLFEISSVLSGLAFMIR